MPTLPIEDQIMLSARIVTGVLPTPRAWRDRCYACYRPRGDCFCAAIPSIDNRTAVLILQHVRERFHAFNTARIVRQALARSTLLVDHTPGLAARLRLDARAGLLYPGPGATLISDLPAEERPKQLVILDGTWHHAKTMMRDIPALRALPRYRLAPVSPSRYRIRREPSDMALSTIEATVAALRALEPDTRGLDQLLSAFDQMVERQLAHPKAPQGWRCHARQRQTSLNIPSVLLDDLENVVVAYGESSGSERGCKQARQAPVYWVAQRLGTGERFACAIRPTAPLSDAILGHLQLARKDFSDALSLDEARKSWAGFLRPSDTLAVYHQSSARLLDYFSDDAARALVLRGVNFNPFRQYATLDELVAGERLAISMPQHPGRAGLRLANAVAFARHLNALGGDSARPARLP